MGKKQRKKSLLRSLNKWWLNYEFKHSTIALIAIIVFIFLLDSVFLMNIFKFIENLGYIGGFITGILSVSFFTAAPAVVLIIELAPKHEPYLLAFVIAIGATIGDWLALKFYNEKVFTELRPLFKKLRVPGLVKIMRHKFTAWILFLVGAFIIATPIPDEVGLSLMGISKFKRRYIIFICFLLNMLGTLAIILAARALQ